MNYNFCLFFNFFVPKIHFLKFLDEAFTIIIHGFFNWVFYKKKYPKVMGVKKLLYQFGQVILYMSNAIGQSNCTLSFLLAK
jgi:hypothetical protein